MLGKGLFFPFSAVENSPHEVVNIVFSKTLNKMYNKVLISSVFVFPAYQCSSRGGELGLEIRDDGRLNIIGRAQIILQGTLKI